MQIRRPVTLLISGLLLVMAFACEQKGYPKPKNLISQQKMVDIIYDIHLGEALAQRLKRNVSDSIKMTEKDIYQSVLDKYKIEDSVLTKSILYYSSFPKKYESIYSRVIERMSQEQEEMNKQEEVKVIQQ